MGISLTTPGAWNITSINRTLLGLLVFLALGFYLYGPPTMPRMHDAARRPATSQRAVTTAATG